VTVCSAQQAVRSKRTGVNRRRVFVFTCLLPTVFLLTGSVGAQQPRVPRVGCVFGTTSSETSNLLIAIRQGLRELGYVEGRTIALEVRWTEGRNERFPALVAELVHDRIDVLVVATTPGALAAKNATSTIPVVMVAVGDPVGSGLVASLGRPGGNLTGLSLLNPELHGKRLALLKEVLPRISRVATLINPGNPIHAVFWKQTQAVAQTLALRLQPVEVRGPEDFAEAFAAAAGGHAGAIIAFDDPLILGYTTQVVALAAKHRLPAIYGFSEFPEVGGLMSYGANRRDMYRRTTVFIDKILKGRKPADLPVEQPTKFELVINLKAAKQIGLTIPPAVLGRADKVIK
jgi:putative ABC transport system substrate-binding protein